MPRLPRYVIPNQPQHVIQRGNNRSVIFAVTADYRFYLDKLGEAAQRWQCDIHSYVLMTNHVHLLLTPHTKAGIGKLMQSLGRYYVQYFNYTYARSGTLCGPKGSDSIDRTARTQARASRSAVCIQPLGAAPSSGARPG